MQSLVVVHVLPWATENDGVCLYCLINFIHSFFILQDLLIQGGTTFELLHYLICKLQVVHIYYIFMYSMRQDILYEQSLNNRSSKFFFFTYLKHSVRYILVCVLVPLCLDPNYLKNSRKSIRAEAICQVF